MYKNHKSSFKKIAMISTWFWKICFFENWFYHYFVPLPFRSYNFYL